LNEFAAGRLRRLTPVAYTTADGMKSNECTGEAQPAGWKTRDGRLWFPTVKGVVVIDPGRLAVNPLPPPVVIEQVLVSQEPVALPTGAELPPDIGELTIQYTGLSFLAPEKVRFKYKLEGLDENWVDVGPRRAAYFTHLPPGKFRFRVIASNNDGVWNETGASFEFSIRPHFYQTPWAYALGVVSVLLIGLAVHRLHVKRMEREFAAVLSERNRVAREIHDTLLQGFAGTALQLEAITQTLPGSPETAREKLARILNQVDRCLTEARRSIWALRSPTLEGHDLVTAVSCLVQQLTAGTSIQSEVSVSGAPRRLPDAVETNLLRIVQEAVTNAMKYAQADRIHVLLGFEKDTAWVKVRDNGCGFEQSLSLTGGGAHLGLVGMRERAELLGGRLSLDSRPGQGTEVAVTVPIKERGVGSWFSFIRRLVAGDHSERTKPDPHHVR
jgi:signal transduction histidine kinase